MTAPDLDSALLRLRSALPAELSLLEPMAIDFKAEDREPRSEPQLVEARQHGVQAEEMRNARLYTRAGFCGRGSLMMTNRLVPHRDSSSPR